MLVLLPHYTSQQAGHLPLSITWPNANPPQLLCATWREQTGVPVEGYRRYHVVGTTALYVLDADVTAGVNLEEPERAGLRIIRSPLGISRRRLIRLVLRTMPRSVAADQPLLGYPEYRGDHRGEPKSPDTQ